MGKQIYIILRDSRVTDGLEFAFQDFDVERNSYYHLKDNFVVKLLNLSPEKEVFFDLLVNPSIFSVASDQPERCHHKCVKICRTSTMLKVFTRKDGVFSRQTMLVYGGYAQDMPKIPPTDPCHTSTRSFFTSTIGISSSKSCFESIASHLKQIRNDILVGGWTNPFEEYARQIGNHPQVGVNIKYFLKPPPSIS